MPTAIPHAGAGTSTHATVAASKDRMVLPLRERERLQDKYHCLCAKSSFRFVSFRSGRSCKRVVRACVLAIYYCTVAALGPLSRDALPPLPLSWACKSRLYAAVWQPNKGAKQGSKQGSQAREPSTVQEKSSVRDTCAYRNLNEWQASLIRHLSLHLPATASVSVTDI